ncbi:hypothetical protein AST13_02170 [Staphylococcus xylosus]|uniref:helix-turn-helix domain-containing protein n=1 Tax=Staphylococcus xylosus TaxID=1288 RepID=UPI000853DDE1|nr:S24 family peptidase [Staphylococcus xylosus]OEL06865.1 hypothetical protein AST13_02170 [Staphylococcus xylosus]
MTSFPENLSYLMDKHDINDSKLAELVDVNRTTVTRWRKGVRSPKIEKLPEIAEVFNVEPLDLIKENNDSEILSDINKKSSQLSKPRQQIVLDTAENQLEEQQNENDTSINSQKKKIAVKCIHAGAAGVIGENLYDDLIEEDVYFYEDEVPKDIDFCVLVNGDSMEPMMKNGSYAFIKKQENIKDGTIALILLDGAGFIKRVDISDDYIKLISLNQKYEDITVSSFNDIRVIGKVVL